MDYHYVAVTLQVKVASKAEAFEMGVAIVEHIMDTFNDDGSIHPTAWVDSTERASETATIIYNGH